MRNRIFASSVMLLVVVSSYGETIKSHYFGNSLTAGTAPDLHGELAAGKSDVWDTEMFGIAGGRLQQCFRADSASNQCGCQWKQDPRSVPF